MSLEFELQKYPKDIKLKDGSKANCGPLQKKDEKGPHEFFLQVPEPERMFIKHRVSDRQRHPGLVSKSRPSSQPAIDR